MSFEFRLISNDFHSIVLYKDVFETNDDSHELDLNDTELAFFQFHIQTMLSKSFEYLTDMRDMLCFVVEEDKNIIQINNYENVQKIF